MALNRFYNPSQAKYQSQFVPKNLPVDLMAKSLYAKQGKADQMMAASVELADWKQAALGDHDTKYVQGIQNELKGFLEQSMTEDRTSPEFQRKYLQFANKIKNDPNLLKVQGAVDRDKEHDERIKELIKKGNHAKADWLDAQYQHSRNEYTKTGGKGFTGDPLSDPLTLEGNDLWSERTKYFKELKDSGSEAIKYLGSGIAYKNGWDGITDSRIKSQLNKTFDDFSESNAGKEDFTKNLYQMGYVQSQYNALDEEKKKEVTNKVVANMKQDFLEAGLTYVHGKSTTNIDQAYNADRAEAKDATEGPMFITTERATTEEVGNVTRDKKIKHLQDKEDAIATILRLDSKKQRLTPENRQAYVEQQATAEMQRVRLQQQKSTDWNDLTKSVYRKVSTEVKDRYKEANFKQSYLANGISNPLLKESFKELSNSDYQTKGGEKNHAANITNLENILRTQTLSTQDSQIVSSLIGLERQKQKITGDLDNKINRKWQQEFGTLGSGKATLNIEYINANTGSNSVMSEINQAVKANSSAFTFKDEYGNILTGTQLQGRVVDFKGGQFSLGDAANSDNFGSKGQIKYLTEKVDGEGNILRDDKGAPYMQAVIKTVTAIPNGANQQFNRDNIAKEYYKNADNYAKMGDLQSAEAAEQAARTYKMHSTYNELRDFQIDEVDKTTFVQVRVPTTNGNSEMANIEVKKIGNVNSGGGYTINFGGGLVETVNNIDDALIVIENYTK